jgi:hypothetical protein
MSKVDNAYLPRERDFPPGHFESRRAKLLATVSADIVRERSSQDARSFFASGIVQTLGTRSARARLGLGLAAALTVSTLLFMFTPSGSVNTVDRASAAVGYGPVIHYIETLPAADSTRVLDLSKNRVARVTRTSEVWYDRTHRRVHLITREDGRVVDDQLGSPRGWTMSSTPRTLRAAPGFRPGLAPALADFVDQYRSALDNKQAEVTGSGTVHGADVLWIRFTSAGRGNGFNRDAAALSITQVAVDHETYKPIIIRNIDSGNAVSVRRIGHIEALPAGRGNFTVSKASSDGAPWSASVTETELIDAATADQQLQTSAVYEVDALAGLPLRAIRLQKINQATAYGKSEPAVGVQFIYGEIDPSDIGSGLFASGAPPFVVVSEATEPVVHYGWTPATTPEAGYARQLNAGSPDWLLRHRDLYITVAASNDRIALDALRELEQGTSQ